MSFSIQRAVSDGTLDTIVLSIEYFDKTDISVFVDDVLLPDGTYTWAWDGLDIKITPAVANGSEVLVRRTTKFDDMYHNFDDGAVFNDTTMDDNFRQLLFIFQEGVEGLTATDFYADLNLHGYRLRKVGNAVEPDDAVPYSQYQADALGAGQFRLLAEAAANAAAASQAAAAGSAVSSSNSSAASAASAVNSQNSADASAASAVTADNHRIAAGNSATAAAASAVTAGTHETNAGSYATAAAASAAAAAASAASVDDANLVHKAGIETITGAKTFSALFTATAGVAVTNGDVVSYGLGGNTNSGRYNMNIGKTAYIGYDGTAVNIVAPGVEKVKIPNLFIPAADGEGGEMQFGVSGTSTLVGGVTVDMNDNNFFRIFETAGTNRGVNLDLGSAPSGTAARLTHSHIPADTIGQLVWAQQVAGTKCDFNQTTSGANLKPANSAGFPTGSPTLTGTYRALGQIFKVNATSSTNATTLWIKIA